MDLALHETGLQTEVRIPFFLPNPLTGVWLVVVSQWIAMFVVTTGPREMTEQLAGFGGNHRVIYWKV